MIDSGYSMWGSGLPITQYLEASGANPANLELGRHLHLDPVGGVQGHRLISTGNSSPREELIEAGRQFESYFISYLLKVMRDTVPQEGALSNKHGAYFHSFYDQEIGRRAAESGGIGITRMVQEHAEKYFVISPVPPSSSDR
jgi:flagellar protein FlgJ